MATKKVYYTTRVREYNMREKIHEFFRKIDIRFHPQEEQKSIEMIFNMREDKAQGNTIDVQVIHPNKVYSIKARSDPRNFVDFYALSHLTTYIQDTTYVIHLNDVTRAFIPEGAKSVKIL